jgi:2'-5' RNA ligase
MQYAAKPCVWLSPGCSFKGGLMTDSKVSAARLFFALWPDAKTRERIASAAAALTLQGDVVAVPQENYHLTLAFVGAASPQLPELLQIGRSSSAPGFTLTFDAYEYWPKPEVAVAAARTIPPHLEQLWQRLHRDLASHQLALNPKRLRPHVTIARKVSQEPGRPAMSPFSWDARAFSLVRSDGAAPRPAYTVVDTWPLLYETAKP